MTHGGIPVDKETSDEPGVEFAWLIETSDDGVTWMQELHPVHGMQESGGVEASPAVEEVAGGVLARRFAALRGDTAYDWDDLWFRVSVWDYHAAVDHAGWQGPPYPPDRAAASPHTYGRYLQVHHAQPHAVQVCTPRQVRAAVWQAPITAS